MKKCWKSLVYGICPLVIGHQLFFPLKNKSVQSTHLLKLKLKPGTPFSLPSVITCHLKWWQVCSRSKSHRCRWKTNMLLSPRSWLFDRLSHKSGAWGIIGGRVYTTCLEPKLQRWNCRRGAESVCWNPWEFPGLRKVWVRSPHRPIFHSLLSKTWTSAIGFTPWTRHLGKWLVSQSWKVCRRVTRHTCLP